MAYLDNEFLKLIASPFENMNVFGAGPSEITQKMATPTSEGGYGLLSPDAIERTKRQSLGQGLITTLASYLAQPKNQNFGSIFPYLAGSYMQGMTAANKPFNRLDQQVFQEDKLNTLLQNQELAKQKKEITNQLLLDPRVQNDPIMKAAAYSDPMGVYKQLTSLSERKAPTQRKRENPVDQDNDGVTDYLETIYEEWDANEGKFKEVSRSPKTIDLDTKFEPETIDLLAAQYEQTGAVPTLGRGKTGEQNRKAVYDKVAERARASGFVNQDGTVNIEEYVADIQAKKQELRSSSLNLNRFDTGPQGNRVESLNVGIDHIVSFRQIVNALKNKDFKDINRLRNYFSQRYSNPQLAAFETAKPIISTEVAKGIIGGNVMTREDRAELQETIDAAQSFDEINAALDTALIMLSGQLEGLRNQYESGLTKRVLARNPFDERLNDKTIKVLKEIRNKYSSDKDTSKKISQEDQQALDHYNSLSDGNATKEQLGKILKSKGLI